MKKIFCLSMYLLMAVRVIAFDPTIPVLDLRDYQQEQSRPAFLENLKAAMRDVGFFALIGTGVDRQVLDDAYQSAKEFFYLNLEAKLACQRLEMNGQRGYVLSESAKGEKLKDYKEFYHIGREMSDDMREIYGYYPNIWPKDLPFFKTSQVKLYSALESYMPIIESAISEVLGQERNFLNEMTHDGDVLMRVIHYPANPPANSIWAAEHTDIDLYTILPMSTAQGLQVKNPEGEWVDVYVPEGAFIINVGDMLENLSNGLCRSSIHRVIDPGLDQERFSIVFFVHPKAQDRLDPLANCIKETGGTRKYANANRWELLEERLIELGLATQEMMQDYVASGMLERQAEVGRVSENAVANLRAAGLLN